MNTGNSSIKKFVQTAMFIAIIIVLDIAQLGLIRTPWAAITILHIPVIIGAITMGPVSGGIIGCSFGLIAMLEASLRPGSPADMLFSPFSSNNPFGSIVMCVGARILLGLAAAVIFRAMYSRGANLHISLAVSAVAATFIHSASVLGLMSILFEQFPLSELFGVIIAVNAPVEMAVAAVVTTAVGKPLLKYTGGMR